MIERLAEDHANARRLAEALSGMDGIVSAGGTAQPTPGPLDPAACARTSSLFKVERDRAAFLAALRARDVEMVEYPHGQVRAVTHYGVTPADIDIVIERHPRGPRRDPASRQQDGRHRLTGRRRAGRRTSPTAIRPHGPTRRRASIRPSPPRSRGVPEVSDRDRSSPRSAAPAPDARGGARPARRRAVRPRRGPVRAAHPRQPGARHLDRPAPGRRPARRRQPRGGPRRARRRPRAPGPDRGDRPGRPVARGRASSATSSATTSAARSSTPTSCASGSAGRSRSTRSATACSCCSPATTPRSPSGSTRSPAGSRRPPPTSRRPRPGRPSRRSAAGSRSRSRPPRELPAFFDELVAAGTDSLPRARAAPPRASERVGQARHRAVRGLARGHAARRHRRLGDRARAARRDGRPARVRRARCRRHPRARLGAPARGARGPRRGRPRGRPRRGRDERHRAGQVRPAGLVRGRPRRLSRRDAPGAHGT